MEFHKEAFEGTVEIVAAAMEEAEAELSAEGGERVGVFFETVYKRLRSIANGEEEEKPTKPGIFEMYQDARGEYRFRLKAANGQIIAVSEGYTTRAACLNGVESVQRSAAGAAVKDV